MMSDTAEALENPSPMGRPSEYSQEVADRICELMQEGKGLREICSQPDMPGRTSVLRWLEANADFRSQYARARMHCMDWYAEEVLKIAFDGSGDIILDGERTVANHAKVQRDRLKVDTLKWIMSKLAPKRYGALPDELAPAELHPVNKIELVGVAAPVEFRWQKIERTIVNPSEQPPEPPRQITYAPPPPSELPPEAWARMVEVLNLIEAHTPAGSEDTPEAVLTAIRDALLSLNVH